jgi:hypothetical protein
VLALDPDLLELLVFNRDVFAAADLQTASDLIGLDDLAGLGVDQLLFQAVAGLLVDAPERDLFGSR